ncbi:hypothetical protein ACFST9_25730 [Hymenobacter monticola]|uniref:Antitoxin VbhA domain-containing protein n=1 Tax=Hymenobacter monticola TaxID=1705399 RepID=A0ABY4BCI4_9BACT|nr:hypothetical protein [Hymenobacter monticola]UOE36859.1 hypothetical protein MTP16_25765 [Hymenobacter monticola]
MSHTPYFSENEQTPAQRWDTVQFALGIAATAQGQASAESLQLYERYIFGEIDLEHVGAAVRDLYPQQSSNDSHAGGWTPNLDAEPARPPQAPPGYVYDPAEEPAAEPEQPADVYVARMRAFAQDIADHLATQPPRQRYIYFDDSLVPDTLS